VMLRTHKIALCPNKSQEQLLRQHVGYARFAYNWALARHIEQRQQGVWENGYVLRPAFNAVKPEIAPWSASLSQYAAKNAILDLHKALQRWGAYRRAVKANNKPRRVGHPKFRAKHGRCQSYQADNGPGTVTVDRKLVVLPKIGAVKMREVLRFDGTIRKVVVKFDGRRWFACVVVESEPAPHIEPEVEACGIDVGITTLASVAYSNGERETIANPKPLAGALSDLRRIDKAIARSKNVHGINKTSNRRLRLYAKRRRLHARIRDIRADHRHKTTTAITKRCGQLSVETLNVAAMMRNKRVARSLADTSMSGWLTTLEHKADFHGRRFNKADRWLPSSKTCSECGEVKAALSLSERQYLCDECGHTDDRDFNAVHNLLAEVQPKRGGDISPDSNSSPAVPTKRKLQTA